MKSLTLYLGADHAGFELKERIKKALEKRGIVPVDLSPTFQAGDDYPLQARKVTDAVLSDKDSRGILVCGSGVGVSMAANRVPGIRAFDAHSEEEVKLAREHENANVLSLGGWTVKEKLAMGLIEMFLKTPFSKAARHHRRVEQLG